MIEEFKDLKEVQMIVFRLSKEEYAVPITCVHEIIMPQVPTRIPKSPHFVEGVINLRGHIIPIIDGKKKFNLGTTNDDTTNNEARTMVLEVEGDTIGLMVDGVSEVIHLSTEDIEPAPVEIGDDSDYLWGVGKFQDRLLILINPEKFLSLSETTDLKSFAKVTEIIKQTSDLMTSPEVKTK